MDREQDLLKHTSSMFAWIGYCSSNRSEVKQTAGGDLGEEELRLIVP